MATTDKKNIYDYILKLCTQHLTGLDFSNPFTINGKVYATNSFLAIRTDEKNPSETFAGPKKEIKIESIFNIEKIGTITIGTHELLGILSGYEMYLDSKRTCRECRGDGNIECHHCGNDAECGSCNGEGQIGIDVPMHQISFDRSDVVIATKKFSAQYIHTIALVALSLGDKVIEMQLDKEKAYIKYSDGTEMVVMLRN